MEVSEFLDKHGLDYHPRSGDQFCARPCPFCGDEKGHFFIHQETGLWDCKSCLESGNLWTLRRHLEQVDPVSSVTDLLAAEKSVTAGVSEALVATYCEALQNEGAALNWLLKRGISKDSIRDFKLGVVKDGMSQQLAIPYYLGGRPVNIKYRTLPPQEKAFQVVAECLTPLFNVDNLDPDEPVFVTEGELDALILIQQGYKNTVSVPMGAGTFKPEHFDALVVCRRINLVFDSDSAGLKGMLNVADRLGPERCYVLKLPVNDVTDFFLSFSRADFEAILAEAATVGRSTVLSLSDAFRELETVRTLREQGEDDVRFPWKNVDRIVGPMKPGWLIVLQGGPFIGKSTFCLNALSHLAKAGAPSLVYCLEMTPVQQLERLISAHRGVEVNAISDRDVAMAKADMYQQPLYLGRAAGVNLSPERVFDTIRYAVKRFGVRIVVFDHLHFLCRQVAHLTEEVGHVIRSFKLLFEELGIPGIVVTHPPKMNTREMPGMYGSRDSGEIAGDADLLISLFRQQTGGGSVSEMDYVSQVAPTFEPRTLVRVTASRYSPGGTAVLYFDGDAMRFEEIGEA